MESAQSVAPASAAVASLPDRGLAFDSPSFATRSRTPMSGAARARGTRSSPADLSSPIRTEVRMSFSFGTSPRPPPSQRMTRRQTRAAQSAGPASTSVAETADAPSSRRARRTRVPRKRKASLMSPPPNAKDPPQLKTSPAVAKKDDSNNDEGDANCCICMCEPEPNEKAVINGCHHIFCFDCIEKWADCENTCPLCKVRFSKIERLNKPARKKGSRGPKNTKRVKNRDQRSDLVPGQALQGLIASLEGGPRGLPLSLARIVFGMPGARGGPMEFSTRRSVGWIESPFAPPPPPAAAAARRRAHSNFANAFADEMFTSDGEPGSEDEESFESFVHRVRALNRQVNTLDYRIDNIGREMFSASMNVPGLHAPARSYASNMNDVDAGETAENALEIESDSDDEVEVVRVVTQADSP